MLASSFRLRPRSSFSQIYQRGQRWVGSLIVVHWLPRPQFPELPSQWAVVVSKKVSAQAVRRNQVKRLIRTHIQGVLSLTRPGFWLIVTARSGILTAAGVDVLTELTTALQLAKVLVPPEGQEAIPTVPSGPDQESQSSF